LKQEESTVRSAKKRRVGHSVFAEQVRAMLKRAARKADDGREICGLLVSNGHCLELVRTKNKAKGPGSFQLPRRQCARIERAASRLGHRVVGTFHSHPISPAVPGEGDIRGVRAGWPLMLILSCWDNDAKLWRIRKSKADRLTLCCLRKPRA
jgi:proteasome lid subunit RPN8/RPN11